MEPWRLTFHGIYSTIESDIDNGIAFISIVLPTVSKQRKHKHHRSRTIVNAIRRLIATLIGILSLCSSGAVQAQGKGPETSAYPVVDKATPDVPQECAAFLGGWTGTWNVSGRVWLWVTRAWVGGEGKKCFVTYAYTSSANPKSFKVGEIKDGVLEAPVPRGTNYFRFSGGQLFDRYMGSGVDDTLQFSRVDIAADPISAAQAATAAITKPAADVPSTCAAFSGRWTGTWGYGIGQQWLWVASVDANCRAKIAYLANSDVPSAFQTVEIKDGMLSLTCGGVDTCKFNLRGEELYAAAYGTSGANNNAVFKRIP
jgi:hypothetical protein